METGALQTLFNQNTAQQIKVTQLRQGQILNGRIIRLFPDQLAEVQIGSLKMVAQLEAPLSANERYWFQVQPGEGKVHLKVITAGSDEGKQSDGIGRILGEFSLTASKENIDLVRFFIKEQLPVSKETLLQAAEWLKTADPRSAGLEAVKMLLTRGLPFTAAAYSAMYISNKQPSLANLMEKLLTELNGAPETEASAKVKLLLNELMAIKHQDVGRIALGKLASAWLNDVDTKGATALSILQQIGAFNVQGDEQKVLEQIFSALQKRDLTTGALPGSLGIAQKVISLANSGDVDEALKHVKALVNNESHIGAGIIGALSSKEAKTEDRMAAFKQLLALASKAEQNGENIEKGLRLMLGNSFLSAAKQLEQASGIERAQLQQLFGLNRLQAEYLANILGHEGSGVSPTAVEPALSSVEIKQFLSALGLSYEHGLAAAFSGPKPDGQAASGDTLKPLLLQLLNEQLHAPLKEAADQLMNKITGLQLLSQETGPIQQLVAQLPFFLGGKMAEVTIQWSGQKNKDGSIDADFCRVLFYLKLEHLDDTIIDMQVQNRVMNIHVLNETPSLKSLSGQLVPMLKDKLAEIDYHLSSVSFMSPGASKAVGQSKKLADLYSKKEYSGVDIKI